MSSNAIGRYLAGMSESITKQPDQHALGRYPFVTISRQAGAGGQSLAETLLRKIKSDSNESGDDWAIFNESMCASIADDPQLSSQLKNLLEERYRSPVSEFVHELIGEPAQDLGYARLAQIIRQIASLGRVIIVGRGASFVTDELPLGVHVRLVAPIEDRQQRMVALLETDAAKALSEMERRDRERAKLAKHHFKADINAPENYDAVWNTSRVSVDQIANAIIQLSNNRWQTQQDAAAAA